MTEAEFVRHAVAGSMAWSPTKREAAFVDRVRELEAMVSEMHASGLRLEFTHEWYVSGVRRDPGTYVLMRIGPAKDAETPF